MKTHCIIVGVGRSGTSLLQSMMNAHQDIEFIPETQFLRNYICAFVDKPDKKVMLALLDNDEKLNRLSKDIVLKLKSKIITGKITSYEAMYKEFFTNSASVNGDKDPRLIEKIDQLIPVFHQIKIIHIYRDIRDIVLSKSKVNWAKNRSYWLNALISEVQLRIGLQSINKLSNKSYLEIKYENLIQDPILQLTKICTFLDLNYSDKMLDFQKSALSLISHEERSWKAETTQDLIATNSGKWKGNFTAFQVFLIESICNSWFKHYNYSPSTNNLLLKVMQVLVAPLILLFSWVYKKIN